VFADPLVEVKASLAYVGVITDATCVFIHQRGPTVHRDSIFVRKEGLYSCWIMWDKKRFALGEVFLEEGE